MQFFLFTYLGFSYIWSDPLSRFHKIAWKPFLLIYSIHALIFSKQLMPRNFISRLPMDSTLRDIIHAPNLDAISIKYKIFCWFERKNSKGSKTGGSEPRRLPADYYLISLGFCNPPNYVPTTSGTIQTRFFKISTPGTRTILAKFLSLELGTSFALSNSFQMYHHDVSFQNSKNIFSWNSS